MYRTMTIQIDRGKLAAISVNTPDDVAKFDRNQLALMGIDIPNDLVERDLKKLLLITTQICQDEPKVLKDVYSMLFDVHKHIFTTKKFQEILLDVQQSYYKGSKQK